MKQEGKERERKRDRNADFSDIERQSDRSPDRKDAKRKRGEER